MLGNESNSSAEGYLGTVFLFQAVASHVCKPRRDAHENAPMSGVLGLAPAVCPRTPTTHWIFCFSAFRMRLRSSSILRFCCAKPPSSPGAYRAGNSIVGPWSKCSPLQCCGRTATNTTTLHLKSVTALEHRIMNIYEEVGMKIHTFLTSALECDEWSDTAILLPGEDPSYLLYKSF